MSTIHDLRSYLAALEANGQLARVKKPVSLKYELADVAAALERSGGPAPLFECPQFYDGREGYNWPVFSSGLAQRDRVATAFECRPDEVPAIMSRVLEPAAGVPPRPGADAAWKANVLTGDQIDLARLPIPWHAVHDGGAFITGGVIVSKDPVSGRGNLSYNRMLVEGPRRLGCNIN